MLESFQVNDYSFDSITELNDNLQYIDFIKANYDFKEIAVDPGVAYRYQGNLFGLFRYLNVDPKLFLYTMYINNLTSPVDFNGEIYNFKIAIKPPIPSS
jgi:hypothetical protein